MMKTTLISLTVLCFENVLFASASVPLMTCPRSPYQLTVNARTNAIFYNGYENYTVYLDGFLLGGQTANDVLSVQFSDVRFGGPCRTKKEYTSYISVYNGDTRNAQLMKRFCFFTAPLLRSQGQYMYVSYSASEEMNRYFTLTCTSIEDRTSRSPKSINGGTVGGVVGGLALVAIIAGIVYLCKRGHFSRAHRSQWRDGHKNERATAGPGTVHHTTTNFTPPITEHAHHQTQSSTATVHYQHPQTTQLQPQNQYPPQSQFTPQPQSRYPPPQLQYQSPQSHHQPPQPQYPSRPPQYTPSSVPQAQQGPHPSAPPDTSGDLPPPYPGLNS